MPFVVSMKFMLRSVSTILLLGAAAGCDSDASRIARVGAAPANAIWSDPRLKQEAIALAPPLFVRHCASCHGADLKGRAGAHAPDLTDNRWLLGGEDIDTFIMKASDVEYTILHGIRADDPKSRNWPAMPARGVGNSLDAVEILAVTNYVLKLSGQKYDPLQIKEGKETYEVEGGCYDCHTMQGWGDTAIGAADLTRPRTWLFGNDREAIIATVTNGRATSSPAFVKTLTLAEARVLAVYVLSKAGTLHYN